MKTLLEAIVLSGVIASLSVPVSAQAAITSTSVSASMQILDHNRTPSFTSVGMTNAGATSASVDLNPSGTPLRVQSSMSFSSLTAESAVFNFLIGMHGNGYSGSAYLGALGTSGNNSGILHYAAAAPMTATAIYNYDISKPGTNIYGTPVIFGMGSISINSPSHNYALPSPTAGHYYSTETFNLHAGDNYFAVSFQPNVSGPIGWIDGQYQGTVTYNFGPAALVPEPETYAMLLAGLSLIGFTARRRKNLDV